MAICITCAGQVSVEAEKCPHCGRPEPVPDYTKCANCNKPIPDERLVPCVACGQKVSTSAEACPKCGKPDPLPSSAPCPHCGHVAPPSLVGAKGCLFILAALGPFLS
jgi:hypothetical protein